MNRHDLRSKSTRLYPNVYVAAEFTELRLEQRIRAAWLWSQRQAVIAGSSAAFLHGARWVDDDSPVELVYRNPRTPTGVVARRDVVLAGETTTHGDLTVTTPARTAFDLGRRESLSVALIRVDSLMRATGVSAESVAELAALHRRARGLRQLEKTEEFLASIDENLDKALR